MIADTREQKTIIDSYPSPSNDYDRADFNLDCNKRIKGKRRLRPLYDACALLMTPAIITIGCFNWLLVDKKPKKANETIIIESTNRFGAKYRFDDRLPPFDEQHQPISIMETGPFPKFSYGLIGRRVLSIYTTFVKRHPFDFFNNLRCLTNISGYYRLIVEKRPVAIVNFRMELNPFSSLIALLCESEGCEFINVMHGETLYNCDTAFVRFSKFYIWDEHYKRVYDWGRSPLDQFVVYLPDMYAYVPCNDEEPLYDITYYLGGFESERDFAGARELRRTFDRLCKVGLKCAVRPHPRWSDIDKLGEIFNGTDVSIEDTGSVSSSDSIERTKLVCGLNSTVLTEAFYRGKGVVLDDVTDELRFSKLLEQGYYLIDKPHLLLSEYVEHCTQEASEV